MSYHPAELFEVLDSGKIKCTACSRYCVLSDGQKGFCGVRINDSGTLVLSAYGNPMAIQVDPIEKNQYCMLYRIQQFFQSEPMDATMHVNIARTGT